MVLSNLDEESWIGISNLFVSVLVILNSIIYKKYVINVEKYAKKECYIIMDIK